MNVQPANRTGIGMALKAATGLLVALLLTFGLLARSASAATTHTPVTEWSTGEKCGPRAVATDAAGNVYVACGKPGNNELVGSVRKFSSTGTPIPFTKSAPYISGNEINEDPAAVSGNDPREKAQFGSDTFIAVDKSSARPGYIYVSGSATFSLGGSSDSIDVFAPSGEYVTSIRAAGLDGRAGGVDVGPDGSVYVMWEGGVTEGHVSKYNPTDFHEVRRWNPGGQVIGFAENQYTAPCCWNVKVDGSGATWAGFGFSLGDGGGPIGKVEADQFTTDLLPGPKDPGLVTAQNSPYLKEMFEMFPGTECPPAHTSNGGGLDAPCYLVGSVNSKPSFEFDTDPTNNDLYLVNSEGEYSQYGNRITPYSQGLLGDPVHQDGPTFGKGQIGEGIQGRHGLEVDPSGVIYATNFEADKIVRFARGQTLPTVTTHPAAIADLGHEEALLRGIVDPMGGESGGEIEDCEVTVEELSNPLPETGTTGDGVPCSEATPYPNSGPKDVTATVTGLTAGHLYHYRFEAANSAGENLGGERVFEAKAVLDLETKPAPPEEIEKNRVTLEGQLNPDNLATEYWYEYGPDKSYGLETEPLPVSGDGIKPTPQILEHLQEGKTYHYRLVASNAEYGTTRGQDMVVRTASPPEITGVGSENVLETSADLHLNVNPVGFDTTYVVEYGTSVAYGNTFPGSGEDIGSGIEPVAKDLHLTNLMPNATIHFRVVATNKWGTSTTDDTTFNFRPPACPNAHVRQLTEQQLPAGLPRHTSS